MKPKHQKSLQSMENVIRAIEPETITDDTLASLHNMITLNTFSQLIPTLQAKIAEVDAWKIACKKRQENDWNNLQNKIHKAIDEIGKGGSITIMSTPTTPFTITDHVNNSTNMTSVKSPFLIDDYKVPHSGPTFWTDNPPKNEKQWTGTAYIFPSTIPSDQEDIQVEFELYQLEAFMAGVYINIPMPDTLS